MRKMFTRRLHVGLLFVAIATIVTIASSEQSFAAADDALTNRSPTPGMMAGGDSLGRESDLTRHILIHSDHGKVHKLKLGIYFTSSQAARNHTINITGGSFTRCTYSNIRPGDSGFRRFVNVEFKSAGSDFYSQDFRADQMCRGDGTTRPRAFTIPSRYIQRGYNNATGLYKVVMEVTLLAPGSMPQRDPGQLVTFGVRATATGVRIGNVDTKDSEGPGNGSVRPNNGIVSKVDPRVRNVKAIFPFGLDCRSSICRNGFGSFT